MLHCLINPINASKLASALLRKYYQRIADDLVSACVCDRIN